MRLQLSNKYFFYYTILMLAFLRVITAKIRACPLDFDCNAYIKMVASLQYNPEILGHHAMRVLPSVLAGFLLECGLSVVNAFRLLSGGTYCLFGVLVYWVLRQMKASTWLSFSMALLCLAPHYAMRIPLQNVYQACDIMTYPLALMIIFFSLSKDNAKWVFILALIGTCVKQNIFVLGVLSLAYCYSQERKLIYLLYAGILISLNTFLQVYYQATTLFAHIIPSSMSFFTPKNLYNTIQESKIMELFIPILPFLIIYFKDIVRFLIRYWHIGLYIGIAIGQPFIAYHLTGNNFQRIALLGAWILYLVVGIILTEKKLSKVFLGLLTSYALAVYFTWGISQRIVLMGAFVIFALMLHKYQLKMSKTRVSLT